MCVICPHRSLQLHHQRGMVRWLLRRACVAVGSARGPLGGVGPTRRRRARRRTPSTGRDRCAARGSTRTCRGGSSRTCTRRARGDCVRVTSTSPRSRQGLDRGPFGRAGVGLAAEALRVVDVDVGGRHVEVPGQHGRDIRVDDRSQPLEPDQLEQVVGIVELATVRHVDRVQANAATRRPDQPGLGVGRTVRAGEPDLDVVRARPGSGSRPRSNDRCRGGRSPNRLRRSVPSPRRTPRRCTWSPGAARRRDRGVRAGPRAGGAASGSS